MMFNVCVCLRLCVVCICLDLVKSQMFDTDTCKRKLIEKENKKKMIAKEPQINKNAFVSCFVSLLFSFYQKKKERKNGRN